MVRNATRLDFPLEPSINSLLDGVDEMVVVVGKSEDDTLARVEAIGDPRIVIVESEWDRSLGPAMLAHETNRALAACSHPWGIYIQADEVLADGGAAALRNWIEVIDDDRRVEGLLVDYRHFYGGFDLVATNRRWYRRECRAVRTDPALKIHSFRDAQGFRVGPDSRRIAAVATGVMMHHYGWARPRWALAAKRAEDREIYPWRREQDPDRELLPWIPGMRRFQGAHPDVATRWIDERRTDERLVASRHVTSRHVRQMISGGVERLTGWRPFEYRNYRLVSGTARPRPSSSSDSRSE